MARSKKSYDPEAAREHVKQAQETLAAAVDTMMTSDGWVNWLRQQSRFHDYSWGNAMLIAIQCPHATYVKGFRGWQDMGRQVRKGEKSIRILAPRPWQRTDEDEDGNTVTSGGISFTTAAIFDISQTDPIEGKKAFEPVERPYKVLERSGDEELCKGVFDQLSDWVTLSHGTTVEVSAADLFGGARGCFIPAKNAIWVQERGCPDMLSTLVHEVAHALTFEEVNKVDGYAAGELVAESVAYIVCDWYGLECLEPSTHYVSAWAQRDSKGLKAVMGVISKTAHMVIEVLEGAATAAPIATEEEVAA